jgi:quercetin dioxygenase-like cupin family protein
MPIHRNMLGAELGDTERIFPAIANVGLGATECSAHENVVVSGAVIPEHVHAVEEVIVCLAGSAECSFSGAQPEPYESGSVVIIPANTPHTIRNVGATELRQLSFFAGGNPRTRWLEPPGSVK